MLSASQQQTLSGRAARVYTPIGASLLCLGGHGLHCSSRLLKNALQVTTVHLSQMDRWAL